MPVEISAVFIMTNSDKWINRESEWVQLSVQNIQFANMKIPLMNCGNMYLLFYFFLENSLVSSRTTSMCEFKARFWRVCFLRELLQCVTLNKACITSMCEFKANFFIKSAPHLSHLNGFWRVWFLHKLVQCVTLNYFPIKQLIVIQAKSFNY